MITENHIFDTAYISLLDFLEQFLKKLEINNIFSGKLLYHTKELKNFVEKCSVIDINNKNIYKGLFGTLIINIDDFSRKLDLYHLNDSNNKIYNISAITLDDIKQLSKKIYIYRDMLYDVYMSYLFTN